MSSIVPHLPNDYPPETPQDPGQTTLVISIDEMLQVAIYIILATLYFVITLLFRFATHSAPDPLDDTLKASGEEPSHPKQPQDPGKTQITAVLVQQVVITAIRATDLTLGLRRIPAGFHVVVKTDGAEFQTSNKSVHVDQAVVEWNEPILLLCEPLSMVQVSVYASFELGPMLCHGEVLRTFEISVQDLLDRSENSHPMIFQPAQEEVVSSCTSLFMSVERRSDENDAAVLRPCTTLMSDYMRTLLLRTDAGHSLLAQYRRMQNSRDLDESINHFEHALDICPMDHPCRPAALFNLATAKFVSCQANETYPDFDIPISVFQDALDLRPTGHPDRPITQLYLAISLLSRFVKRGFPTDADTAEGLLSEVLNICHVKSHIFRAALLAVESSALRPAGNTGASDFGQVGPAASMFPLSPNQLAGWANQCLRIDDPHALDEVISLHYDALGYYHDMHACRGQLLCNLGAMLRTRFERRGNAEDLDHAITLQGEALALYPVGHTVWSSSLNNLANVLSTRFYHRGNVEDLDETIALHREALALRPVGHTDRPSSLDNLAVQLSTRFDHRGNAEDLDQAIALHREALALLPVCHTNRPLSFINLAVQLSARFDHRGSDEDLDEAIALNRKALTLLPVGHIVRSSSLNNLAIQLSTCFDRRGNLEDLDESIALHREALALRPVGHPDRSPSLNNLANQLFTRFGHRHNEEDLTESREHLRCALTLLTQHDPRQLVVHKSLAIVYLSLYRSGLDGPGEDTVNLNAAMHHLKAAAGVVSGGLLPRLRASLRWVHDARQHSHDTELEAYATSMQLLDAYMSTTASVSYRHNALKDFPGTLAVDAASCALRSGDACRAVELLEQGRTVIWTQMTRLRTPLNTLQTHSDHAAALMKRFRDLSSLLDRPPANHADGTQSVDVEAEDTRYRRLVKDWNGVVEEIRKIEGFSRFLLPPLFADLQEAARGGPVIMLVVSRSSCDAIIIPHQQPPTSIQLPTNFEKLDKLVLALREAIGKDTSPKGNQTELIKVLRKLWDDVVRPVVENLGGFARRGSRIWWCPTSLFNFLPLHAAGEYRANGKSLSQQYISSYTPSLTALMRARRSHDRSPSVPFAAIGQNCPAGHSSESTLEFVEPELKLVRSLLPPPPAVSFTKITSVDATKSRALCALQDNTWLHFACHGTQNFRDPFDSAFLMRDQPLSLLDITQMDISLHEFAFLSACETAVGDLATPDEVIHLAAGLQFAGVKSVVGTLWKVNDSSVQRLVEAFYKNLCGDGTMNSKRAARALHQAVHSLARDKDMPLDQRIVFIHVGI